GRGGRFESATRGGRWVARRRGGRRRGGSGCRRTGSSGGGRREHLPQLARGVAVEDELGVSQLRALAQVAAEEVSGVAHGARFASASSTTRSRMRSATSAFGISGSASSS